MYVNIKEHTVSGTLYQPGEHTITEAEYNTYTPEGKALYEKSAVKQGKNKNTENGNNTGTAAETGNI